MSTHFISGLVALISTHFFSGLVALISTHFLNSLVALISNHFLNSLVALISTHFPSGLVALILGRNETTGLRCMGTCHPMATLKYIDSVTSFLITFLAAWLL